RPDRLRSVRPPEQDERPPVAVTGRDELLLGHEVDAGPGRERGEVDLGVGGGGGGGGGAPRRSAPAGSQGEGTGPPPQRPCVTTCGHFFFGGAALGSA